MKPTPRPRPERPEPAHGAGTLRASDPLGSGAGRRRASWSLWRACEALLSALSDPRALPQALEDLRAAFDCDAVVLRARGPVGTIEPWQACGNWATAPGDLRDCLTVPLLRGAERVGTLDLLARPGQRWQAGQLGLVRAASGALGAALGARFELEQLRRQPGRDPVTGLPDTRALRERLGEELARVREHGATLALVLVQIERFAALEKRYGEGVARAVLAEAALVLRLALRETDVLSRGNGARLAVLLPEIEPTAALRCAERLRHTLEDHRFARVGRVAVSAGVATSPRDGMECVEILEQVERALALATKTGRRHAVGSEPSHVH